MLDENGKPLSGKKADLYEYFKTHNEFTEKYTLSLNEQLSSSADYSGNLLDAETAAQIQKEDEGVVETLKKAEKENAEDRVEIEEENK